MQEKQRCQGNHKAQEACMSVIPSSGINAVIEAANRGDLDGMLSHFAQDAVLTLNPRLPALRTVYRGRQAIRDFIRRIMESGMHVEHGPFETSGDEVRWHSTVSGGLFAEAGIERADVASQAIVQGGLIRAIDIHYDAETVRRLEAALAGQA